jgi:hypothetical protein
MNARPYPEGFSTWGEDEGNAYFAKAAAAYREKTGIEDMCPKSARPKIVDEDIAPPPLSPIDYGALERRDILLDKDGPRFQLVAFNDIKPDDKGAYLIKGLLPRVGLTVVWGAPKCGKSFWTFDALMHVALGWGYRGHRVAPGPVVYCALEGVQGFRNRVEAFRQAKLSEADCASPPFYLMAGSLSLVADHEAIICDIREQLGGRLPVAVCLDTLNRSLAGSESSDEDKRLDVNRRNQPYGVPETADGPSPLVRRRARFHRHNGGRLLSQEAEQPRPLEAGEGWRGSQGGRDASSIRGDGRVSRTDARLSDYRLAVWLDGKKTKSALRLWNRSFAEGKTKAFNHMPPMWSTILDALSESDFSNVSSLGASRGS